MKLYQSPGGTWAGTEKGWKDAVKAEGLDPKKIERRTVDVPTSKPELMEFLTFHSINILNPAQPGEAPAPTPSTTVPDASGKSLSDLFAAAPLHQQLDLAIIAIDGAVKKLR